MYQVLYFMNIGIEFFILFKTNSKISLFRLKCSFGNKPASVISINQSNDLSPLRSTISSDSSIVEMQKIVKKNIFIFLLINLFNNFLSVKRFNCITKNKYNTNFKRTQTNSIPSFNNFCTFNAYFNVGCVQTFFFFFIIICICKD